METATKPKLTGKIFIKGDIEALTGLHIGGSKASLDIGGVDLNVIKTPGGVPFIPGSSLKGKLRTMMARIVGSVGIQRGREDDNSPEVFDEDKANRHICEIFGLPTTDDKKKGEITRLVVRDADLDKEAFDAQFKDADLDMDYSQVKWENTINRKTGTAEHPRQLERVPAGARFKFEMVYDVYSDNRTADHLGHLRMAMYMLQNDYLGGQGSRGYGKIEFKNVAAEIREIADYENGLPARPYDGFTF